MMAGIYGFSGTNTHNGHYVFRGSSQNRLKVCISYIWGGAVRLEGRMALSSRKQFFYFSTDWKGDYLIKVIDI